MVMFAAFFTAHPTQVCTQRAEVAVMIGMSCQCIQRRRARVGAVQVDQRTLRHAWRGVANVVRRAGLARMQSLFTSFNAFVEK